jgi:hypothetical protein
MQIINKNNIFVSTLIIKYIYTILLLLFYYYYFIITILLLLFYYYYFIITILLLLFINLSSFKIIFLYVLYIKWQDILKDMVYPNVFVQL